MGFNIQVAIGYKDIFDDYDKVNLEDLLEDIPTKNSLQILGYFMAQLHAQERNKNLQMEFLKMWLGRLPNSVQQSVQDFMMRVKSKNSQYSFLDNTSLLILVEKILINHNELEIVKDLSSQQELQLFKAYLYCCQEWIDKQYPNFVNLKIKNELDIIKVLLPSQIPYQEIQDIKDFRIQFIKAIYFFKFCEANDEFKNYLQIFLNEYKLSSWHEYLKNLLSLYVRKFEELKTPSVINVTSDFPEVISFLKDLSLNSNNYESKIDFLNLREKPIYQIDENNFIFLNLNFLVDKIYQGIQFDFAKVLLKNSATSKGKVIKSTGDFMGIFGNEFSETGLFYNVMNFAFAKSQYKKLEGDFMKNFINAEPDYYMRDKGKVYLFEFKNVYLAADVKHSYDLNVIQEELFKKFVQNQHGKPKGISQLLNSIESIRNGEYERFDSFDYKNALIYPIIVYVDFSFNLPGVNYILNKEFKNQLERKGIHFMKNVQTLAMIDLDTFIKFQDLFRNKKIKLNNLLNQYFETLTNHKDVFDRIGTFNTFIHAETSKMDYDSPMMLMEELGKIFPEDK
jgi:hypothetical protein